MFRVAGIQAVMWSHFAANNTEYTLRTIYSDICIAIYTQILYTNVAYMLYGAGTR